MVGAPHFLSRTTLRPLGPSVTLTASASWFMPRSSARRASSSNAMIFAMRWNPSRGANPERPAYDARDGKVRDSGHPVRPAPGTSSYRSVTRRCRVLVKLLALSHVECKPGLAHQQGYQ